MPLDGRDDSTFDDVQPSDADDKMFSTLRDFRAIKTGFSSHSNCSKTFSTAVFTLLTEQHDTDVNSFSLLIKTHFNAEKSFPNVFLFIKTMK